MVVQIAVGFQPPTGQTFALKIKMILKSWNRHCDSIQSASSRISHHLTQRWSAVSPRQRLVFFSGSWLQSCTTLRGSFVPTKVAWRMCGTFAFLNQWKFPNVWGYPKIIQKCLVYILLPMERPMVSTCLDTVTYTEPYPLVIWYSEAAGSHGWCFTYSYVE